MIVTPSTLQRLKACHLFAGLDETQTARALSGAEMIELREGEQLFAHGQPAEHFYWVELGLIKLGRTSPMGDEKIIEVVSVDQTFAEAIMFMGTGGRYPVTAQALEPSRVLRVSSAAFLDVLRQSVDACFRVMAGMSRRLHQHVNEIDRLTLQNASERVAHYLLQHVAEGKAEVELNIAKHVLAAQLAIKPETLSRTFARLAKEGVIAVQGNLIEIRDLEALRKLS